MPKGTVIYEGIAAPQKGASHFLGGGHQIYVDLPKNAEVIKKQLILPKK